MYKYDLVCTKGKWYGIIWRDGIWYYETDAQETRESARQEVETLIGI